MKIIYIIELSSCIYQRSFSEILDVHHSLPFLIGVQLDYFTDQVIVTAFNHLRQEKAVDGIEVETDIPEFRELDLELGLLLNPIFLTKLVVHLHEMIVIGEATL